jgi:hypothetical protein
MRSAWADGSALSLTMKAKLSKPIKSASGVKVTVAMQVPSVQEASVIALKVPWAGGVTIIKVNGVPSGSEPVSVIVTDVPSAVLTDWRLAVGVLLTAVTVIETMVTSESKRPSLTLKVKLSEPLKFRFGV